jgi:hypothetical protein
MITKYHLTRREAEAIEKVLGDLGFVRQPRPRGTLNVVFHGTNEEDPYIEVGYIELAEERPFLRVLGETRSRVEEFVQRIFNEARVSPRKPILAYT